LMEALAVELPVIATDISGVPELIEDGVNGLLVPERDPQAIAAAVERMVESPQFSQQLGAAGRAKVLAEFDLHENARALWDLINQAKEQQTDRQADWLPEQKAELLSEGERS
ncbi:MAG TPA: glycosyltransferase, partial [Anaerolineales bacterium]|nr:glycosyltransferase [Anaerolineales bacterium]